MRPLQIINLIIVLSSVCCLALEDELKSFLDSMEKMMTGNDKFDNDKYYHQIVECLEMFDPKLLKSVNVQFQGLRHYANKGGNPPGDVWHTCNDTTDNVEAWLETNCTVQEYGDIPIWEPCNYASNVAYFKTVIEICQRPHWAFQQDTVDTFGKVFSSMVLTSSFLHASQTHLGGILDSKIIDLFTYAVYQETVNQLKMENGSSILHEISHQPRGASAKQIIDDLMYMYIEIPVEEWSSVLNEISVPPVRDGMCAFIIGTLTLLFPDEEMDELIYYFQMVSENISGMESLKEFCFKDFLAVFRQATVDLKPLPVDMRTDLLLNTISITIKAVYAFLWEEHYLMYIDTFLEPTINLAGAMLQPLLNELSTLINTYGGYSDPFFQLGQGFFPGESTCNSWNPHTKWHLQTSIVLVDYAFLADRIYNIILQSQDTLKKRKQ